MSDEKQDPVTEIVGAINRNSQHAFQSTRELRDKVEVAARQIEALSQTLTAISATTSSELKALTEAINRYSTSSDKLSGRMVALTAVLAIATVVSTIVSCISVLKH